MLAPCPSWCQPLLLAAFSFCGLLGFLPCPSGLLFCSVPISCFSVPYFLLSIPSSTPVQGSSLSAPSPSGELQPPSPSPLFLCLFAWHFLFLSEDCVLTLDSYCLSLPLSIHASIYYPTYLWGSFFFFVTVYTPEYPLFFYHILLV